MSKYPDFTANGYQTLEQLNQNVQGGRVTYKALHIRTQKLVVIKQFRFATTSDWSSYKEIEREIEVLKGLNHPRIPKYLTQFDPGDGLCLVQEYKEAKPLSHPRHFSPEEIKSIAVQFLEILVFLQEERIPPIFHRDIKPENVLVDDNINAYLVDFGLAKSGKNTLALSSLFGGTLGFMPPEQIHNQKLTKASDLYGLGATLICLLTQTKSIDIGELVDFSTNRITFRDQVPTLSIKFIQWLEKMVEPNPSNRYQSANSALQSLQTLDIIRTPEAKFYGADLNFAATKVGEKITKEIRIANEVPDTMLEGQWSVAPHSGDPPHTPDTHPWIKFSPQKFKGNEVKCAITVDTSKLKAGKSFRRKIIFTSNTEHEVSSLEITVKTAVPKIKVLFPPYATIVAFMLIVTVLSGLFMKGVMWLGTLVDLQQWGVNVKNMIHSEYNYLILVLFIFVGLGLVVERKLRKHGVIALTLMALFCPVPGMSVGIILAIIWRVFDNLIVKLLRVQFHKKGFKNWMTNFFVSMIMVTGIFTGIVSVIGFQPWGVKGLVAFSAPLITMLLHPPIKLITMKTGYRRLESQNLIIS